ncbi:FG-GAP repeat protein [Planctomycetes bacterium Pla163]|uniref:FG-GAP repeat protein n=1 Tax=Rohdeia mirabilis TaxID=2528008 RepID=A0A518CUV8_9BACT|nr:FG-GAP repeat protein [Planctomycetes bacterium Pla163]
MVTLFCALALLAPTCVQGAPAAAATADPPKAATHGSTVIELEDDATRVALRDLDGDGRRDVVLVGPAGVRVRIQDADGTFGPERGTADGAELFRWPGDHLAWCLADLDGDGAIELVVLGGDGVVSVHPAGADGVAESRVVLESQCYLPHGLTRMGFARDVNVDGRVDLVLPGAGEYRIHLRGEDGTYADAIRIAFDVNVRYEVGDPTSLDSSFGQTVRVPWFGIEDVDGDGLEDLVARTADRVDFYLARPELPAAPTWSLDLEKLRRELPERGDIDFDNLLANIEPGVEYTLAELDGVAPRDLVLQMAGTVKVYLGGSVRGVDGDPDQVLRISGNLLDVLVRDTDGDGVSDLQMLRGDKVSLGRVLRWLILPGTLDFELFTYRNEGGAFSRKPTRRNTVSLKIPRLLSLIEQVEEVEDEVERQQSVPARRIRLAPGAADAPALDVVDVRPGQLDFFAACAPPLEDDVLRAFRDGDVQRGFQDLVLDDLDRMGDGETKVIDVGDLDTWTYSPGAALRESHKGREPVSSVPTVFEGDEEPAIVVSDLDGDGGGDVVLWRAREGGGHTLQLIVLRN